MLVARVLKIAESSDKKGSSMAHKQILVSEMDVSTRKYKGTPLMAENIVGAVTGDMVLCSTDIAKKLAAIGVIHTVELIGEKVYEQTMEKPYA
jgi:microcompartment protein CcmK/EutM